MARRVKVGDPGVNVQDRVDAAQAVLPGLFFVVDEGGRQGGLVLVAAG